MGVGDFAHMSCSQMRGGVVAAGELARPGQAASRSKSGSKSLVIRRRSKAGLNFCIMSCKRERGGLAEPAMAGRAQNIVRRFSSIEFVERAVAGGDLVDDPRDKRRADPAGRAEAARFHARRNGRNCSAASNRSRSLAEHHERRRRSARPRRRCGGRIPAASGNCPPRRRSAPRTRPPRRNPPAPARRGRRTGIRKGRGARNRRTPKGFWCRSIAWCPGRHRPRRRSARFRSTLHKVSTLLTTVGRSR